MTAGLRWRRPFGAGLSGQHEFNVGHLGLGSNVQPSLKWLTNLKFEFDDHLIFYNSMFDFQFHFQLQRSVNYCLKKHQWCLSLLSQNPINVEEISQPQDQSYVKKFP